MNDFYLAKTEFSQPMDRGGLPRADFLKRVFFRPKWNLVNRWIEVVCRGLTF